MRHFGFGVLLCALAFAQFEARAETPKIEFYAGYSFLHFQLHAETASSSYSYTGNKGGLDGQLEYNINRWIGLVGDYDAFFNSVALRGASAQSYLAGPRLNVRRGRMVPFTQILVGGIYQPNGILNSNASENDFAMAVGGGLDYALSRHIAVRPVQAEYFMMRAPDGLNNQQNGVRLSGGVVVRLGGSMRY